MLQMTKLVEPGMSSCWHQMKMMMDYKVKRKIWNKFSGWLNRGRYSLCLAKCRSWAWCCECWRCLAECRRSWCSWRSETWESGEGCSYKKWKNQSIKWQSDKHSSHAWMYWLLIGLSTEHKKIVISVYSSADRSVETIFSEDKFEKTLRVL